MTDLRNLEGEDRNIIHYHKYMYSINLVLKKQIVTKLSVLVGKA